MTVRLRTLVASIGLIATLTVFVSIPCGYFYVEYANKANELAYKSELAAARVAKYVYLHRTLWQYQAPRIAELVELSQEDGNNFALDVHDEADKVVVSMGPALPAPVLVRSHPVVISGDVIGRVETKSSLRPLLSETSFAALLGAVFGIGIYFAVRVFPLTVLDRTLGALETANATIRDGSKQLQVQNERFDAALTHMSQGLVMFDSSARLVVFN